MACYNQGKFDESEILQKQVLERRETQQNHEHVDTLYTAHGLGWVYMEQDRLDEAEMLLIRALRGQEKWQDLEHGNTPRTAKSLEAPEIRREVVTKTANTRLPTAAIFLSQRLPYNPLGYHILIAVIPTTHSRVASHEMALSHHGETTETFAQRDQRSLHWSPALTISNDERKS